MKMTLLEMVQSILSDTECDEVNSIGDTVESDQVASIIRDVYFQMLAWAATPELHNAYFNLEGLGDVNRPTYLQLPDDVVELFWWKYNTEDSDDTQQKYTEVRYCAPEHFFERLWLRDKAETNITEYNTADGVPLLIQTDKGPEFYTILEDKYIVADSFDSDEDSTLQASKTVAAGSQEPTFTLADGFTPELDSNLFPLLLAEAKAVAFVVLKQQQVGKMETIARQQKVHHQNQRHRFKDRNTYSPSNQGADYGRRPRR